MIRATTFPQFMEQFCSLIKTRLGITANVTDDGIRVLRNFQKIVDVDVVYFVLKFLKSCV